MKEKICGIYCILHVRSGRQYIGSSVDIHHRWQWHRGYLKKQKHHSRYLQRAWNKYGPAEFKFEILEIVSDPADLENREQHWLNTTKSANPRYGFNICPTARTCLGLKPSKKARANLSKALKGKYVGSQQSHAKLTENQVSEIKVRLLRGDKFKDIANDYGVTDVAISRIATNGTWSHVPWPGITLAPGERVILDGNHRTGVDARRAALTREQVIEIKILIVKGLTNTSIAKTYNVDIGTVCSIRKGRTYQDVAWPDSATQSMLDRFQKEPPNAGSRNNQAKLTEEQVLAIRRRLPDNEPLKQLASDYGVSYLTIYQIKRNETWKHISDDSTRSQQAQFQMVEPPGRILHFDNVERPGVEYRAIVLDVGQTVCFLRAVDKQCGWRVLIGHEPDVRRDYRAGRRFTLGARLQRAAHLGGRRAGRPVGIGVAVAGITLAGLHD